MNIIDVNTLFPYKLSTRENAEHASLKASITCLSDSPLDPFAVARAVGMEAEQREAQFNKQHTPTEARVKGKTLGLLGCYVNGVLKFQSRDHAAIHGYARDKMSDTRNSVWVAPVGSFQNV